VPDITKQTVSASQMPAILNRSPYATRFTMYQHFAEGFDVDPEENERMEWGSRLEPTILRAAADELRAEVLPHDQAVYFRHPSLPVGCTPDGYVLDPQRGLGFVEAKNVDWMRWRDTWTDTLAPDHVEVQHQVQLMTPHPEFGIPKWGAIACLVGGNDFRLYPREPGGEVQQQIAAEASRFLDDVRHKREPEVLGRALELPALIFALPRTDREKVLTEADFDDKRAIELALMIEAYEFAKARESGGKKDAEEIKVRLLAAAGDAASMLLHGRRLNISRVEVKERTQVVKAHVQMRLTAKVEDMPTDLSQYCSQANGPDLPQELGI